MNILVQKFKNVITAVIPITLIVILIHFLFVPLTSSEFIRFFIGAFLVAIGLTLFLFGVDIGIEPIGDLVGGQIARSNKLYILIIIGIALGFFISIAEPGLIIYSQQVSQITENFISSWLLTVMVSIGIAIFLAIAFLRIIYNIPLNKLLTVFYAIILILSIFVDPTYLIFAFDASGSTTGVLAVPFIFALALGISHLKKDTKASQKDSFGTIAIVSAGAILSVLVFGLFNGKLPEISTEIDPEILVDSGVLKHFFNLIIPTFLESLLSLIPLLIIFLAFNFVKLKLNKRSFIKIIKGLVYTLFGLVIFLIGTNGGFMFVGAKIGEEIIQNYSHVIIILVGFALGTFTIFAEPAVHVLTHQIADVTSGYISRRLVLIFLAFGVGLALVLSMLRILVVEIDLWHILLPGYLIVFVLSYIVPKIFVGIAFDAGGVATGPMTATFILAFVQGAAYSNPGSHPILDGLGMIALVAMMPIITLQILGVIFKIKTRKVGIDDAK